MASDVHCGSGVLKYFSCLHELCIIANAAVAAAASCGDKKGQISSETTITPTCFFF